MQRFKRFVGLILWLLVFQLAKSQSLVNFQHENIQVINGQSILLHKPIIAGSIKIYCTENQKQISNFKTDYIHGVLYFPDSVCTKISVSYRYYNHDFSVISSPFNTQETQQQDSINQTNNSLQAYFHSEDLKKNKTDNSKISMQGSIARGINVGNNQDAVLNSVLDLQVDGDLGNGLMLKASITDRNIPIQPDGTTQQLQDFDQVFIQIYNPTFKLTAGDFSISQNKDKFLRYQRKSQGALLETHLKINDNFKIHSKLSGAAARGKYHRMEIQGEEGNQGPYKLTGKNNESWIIVLSGSERIYIDGELLTRGQSADYIIDYNTGELSFTANRLITKDSRITAEFEYSDRNYNRFTLMTEHSAVSEKATYFVRYFSDTDAKNQPIDQNLDADKRLFLSGIGDNLSLAAYPSFDSLGFKTGQIRYRLTDTVVNGIAYDSIFVYSVNPSDALYLPRFSMVGTNQGNYVKLISAANGKVYEWVAPINGVPQGNYEPVTLLITPKKQQMMSLGGTNKIGEKTAVNYEFALSNEDKNMYSNLDAHDNKGYALNTGVQHNFINKKNKSLIFNANYAFIQHNFSAIENFRETEFTRNWNLKTFLSDINEHTASAEIEYLDNQKIKSKFKTSALYRTDNYQGFRQDLQFSFDNKGWKIILNGNLLNAEGINSQSRFIKHKIRLGKELNKIAFYTEEYHEWNDWQNNDTLLAESFRFQEIKAGIKEGKTSKNQWNIEYRYRLDELPQNHSLVGASESHDIKAGIKLISNTNTQLNANLGYRNLNVLKKLQSDNNNSQNNLTAQMQYTQKALNGFLQSRMFYESGSGLELKKEFTYIEVPAGQGIYRWNDYNGNGIEELNEFEISTFPDQAKYIRIYTPTNESIKTFNNQLSLSLQLRPEKLFQETKGKFWKRFYNQTGFNLSNKNTANLWYNQYTPLSNFIEANQLVSLNNLFRNTLYFNRFSNTFTLNFTHQRNQSKSLLVNGLDEQGNVLNELKGQLSFTRSLNFQFEGSRGNNTYKSEFFSNKNYDILWEKAVLSFNYQPTINMRLKVFSEFTHKENLPDNIFSRLFSPGVEYRNNNFIQGMISLRFNYTFAEYNGSNNSALEYQMLNALLPGNNYILNISFQKRLVNGLQLNLNYQGRKSENKAMIHTGGIQIRAYF